LQIFVVLPLFVHCHSEFEWQLLCPSCFLPCLIYSYVSIHGLFPIPETTLEPLKKTQWLHRKSLTHLLPFSQKIQVAYGWHKLG
jgi:hypothetical protein